MERLITPSSWQPRCNLAAVPPLIEKNREEYTWECVRGTSGEYKGVSFIYQGCGVMEPRESTIGTKTYYSHQSCPCELAAMKAQKQDEQNREVRASLLRQAFNWLGPEWSDLPLAQKTFESFQRTRQSEAFEMTRSFADILSGTLLLYGPFGTGKTHLLAALCGALAGRKKASRFVTAPKLFHVIQEYIGTHESYVPFIQRAIETPLLVIDDIDKAKRTDFREEIYFEIIDERTKRGLPIAISTNRVTELADFVGGAVASRLSIGQIAIEMTGDDYRKEL